jgi:hypothetical protein
MIYILGLIKKNNVSDDIYLARILLINRKIRKYSNHAGLRKEQL